ncbi:MAG: hypothetical protein K0Q48_2829 [Bacillota bacterium]|jgi:hypothetical protein|nr:hypothetical protein [Bacillota bacterium]
MKKNLAIILSIIMVAVSFTGCSQAERGYLNMSRQLAISEVYQTSGSVSLELDFDALAALTDKTMAQITQDDEYDSVVEVTDEFSKLGLKGTNKFEIKYDMIVDMKSKVSIWTDFDLKYNNKMYEMGDIYFHEEKGLYVSKDLLINLYDLLRDLKIQAWDSYFFSEDYRNELLKALGTEEYIYTGDFLELTNESDNIDGAETNPLIQNAELYDAVFKLIETTFSGFTTGTASQISGGYKISLNGTQVKKLIPDILQYLIDNIGKVITAYKDYTTILLDALPEATEEEKSIQYQSLDEISSPNSKIMISSYLAMAKQMFIEADKAGYLNALNGFSYNETLKKSGTKYTASQDIMLKDGAITVFSLKKQADIINNPNEIKIPNMPESRRTFDDVSEAIDSIENKINPVIGASIEWWNDDYDYGYEEISIEYHRAKASPFSSLSEFSYEPYFIKDKRLYVPMRSIAEKLGEKVEWDQKSKTPYVIRSGKQMKLEGIMKDGITYIKVVDFEKLGYSVTYEYDKEWGLHTAYISK